MFLLAVIFYDWRSVDITTKFAHFQAALSVCESEVCRVESYVLYVQFRGSPTYAVRVEAACLKTVPGENVAGLKHEEPQRCWCFLSSKRTFRIQLIRATNKLGGTSKSTGKSSLYTFADFYIDRLSISIILPRAWYNFSTKAKEILV